MDGRGSMEFKQNAIMHSIIAHSINMRIFSSHAISCFSPMHTQTHMFYIHTCM